MNHGKSTQTQLSLPLGRRALNRRFSFGIAVPIPGFSKHAVEVEAVASDGAITAVSSSWQHAGGPVHCDLLDLASSNHDAAQATEVATLAARTIATDLWRSWDFVMRSSTQPALSASTLEPAWSPVERLTELASRDIDWRRGRAVAVLHASVRRSVYTCLHPERDPNGWIMQLVAQHPTLAGLCGLAVVRGCDDALGLVLAGVSLAVVVESLGAHFELDAESRVRFARMAHRIPASEDPKRILAVAQYDIPASDMPRERGDCVMWLRVVHRTMRSALSLRRATLSPIQLDSVARQVSRHYRSMENIEKNDLERCLLTVALSDHVVPREHDRQALLRWAEHVLDDDPIFEAQDLAEHYFDIPATLPPAPFCAYTSGSVSITPVVSAEALRAEGKRMKHCVVTYAQHLAEGTHALYHVTIDSDESTLMLKRHAPGKWQVLEHLGVRNAPVSREAEDAVTSWLEQQRDDGTDAHAPAPCVDRG